MSNKMSRVQGALYRVFLITGSIAVILALLMIWGFAPGGESGELLFRVLFTSVVLAVASAFAMSATRLVAGRCPEEDR